MWGGKNNGELNEPILLQHSSWLQQGADEEAKRWIACEPYKRIVYASRRAVRIEEFGNYLSPLMPIPPKGFLLAAGL